MNTEGRPVKWGQQTLYLSELTAGHKDAFCAWVVNTEVEKAFRYLRPDLQGKAVKVILATPTEWTTIGTDDVGAALGSQPGILQINRILFGLTPDEVTDAELRRLIEEKQKDPASDYVVAMAQIQAAANPKAPTASPGSAGPTPTAPAATGLTPTSATSTPP